MGGDRCGASHLRGHDGPLAVVKDVSVQAGGLSKRLAWILGSETWRWAVNQQEQSRGAAQVMTLEKLLFEWAGGESGGERNSRDRARTASRALVRKEARQKWSEDEQ